jgi:hypothetical protein
MGTLNNCTLTGNSAASAGGGGGGGADLCTLNNCTLTGNSSPTGGGARSSTLNTCLLTGNSGSSGGGAHNSTLNSCTVAGNSASTNGGGAYGCTLNNCTVTNNSAPSGAGVSGDNAYLSVLTNCTLAGNSASVQGGGAGAGTLNNCTLTGNTAPAGGGAWSATLASCILVSNSASLQGGGAYSATLANCTLTGNSAPLGGGACSATLNNCIIYYNAGPAGSNYALSVLNSCCTAPLPANGADNLAADPQLASFSHLSAGSPCRGAGNPSFATGVDIDGEPWANPPSIGCDEFYSGSATGAISVSIQASCTNVAPGFAVDFVGTIAGYASASAWDFGDGTVVSNRPYASHAWTAAGQYAVVLRAYNDSNPVGVTATLLVTVVIPHAHYVALSSVSPSPPYCTWATAATNIQDAVDVAAAADEIVVTNGVYGTEGRVVCGALSNRVAVTKAVTLRSVNGPTVTVIQGNPGLSDSAVRGVYLTNGAVLAGFTITNGATRTSGDTNLDQSGGGIWCESTNAFISNCLIAGNSANQYGGGVYRGTLSNCMLTNNTAGSGGGVCGSMLNRCTLAGNVAAYGGGAYASTLNNCVLSTNGNFYGGTGGGAWGCMLSLCILAGNVASFGGGAYSSTLNSCTLAGNSANSDGAGAYGGTLNNCALTGNSAGNLGGGACSSTLNYCLLTGNSAWNVGGGVETSTLNNCVLTGNSASWGGGADGGTLNNCTLTGNSANTGGGAYYGTLNNCIAYYNTGPRGSNYASETLNYCCTAPLPASGSGNFTNAPLFVDLAGGSFRVQTSSRCINAGNNAYASGATDFGGDPRLVGGTVDVGAFELQNPPAVLFPDWLQQYGLPADGSADYADSDGDGMNNWQEWIAGTDPTNSASVLKMLSPVLTPAAVLVRWSSDPNRSYFVQHADSLRLPLSFRTIGASVPGLAGTTDFRDTAAARAGVGFYRVGTDSTNGSTPLLLQAPAFVPASATITWFSVSNRSYFVQRATNLGEPPAFSILQTNIAGLPDTTSFTDTNAPATGPAVYRVGVQQ